MTVRGGRKFKRLLDEAARQPPVDVAVGIIGDRGLALVAARNEFGVGIIPERPFMRGARTEIESATKAAVAPAVRANDGLLSRAGAEAAGAAAVGVVKDSIRNMKQPPNAPATVRSKGRNDPLEETGKLRESIRAEVRGGVV